MFVHFKKALQMCAGRTLPEAVRLALVTTVRLPGERVVRVQVHPSRRRLRRKPKLSYGWLFRLYLFGFYGLYDIGKVVFSRGAEVVPISAIRLDSLHSPCLFTLEHSGKEGSARQLPSCTLPALRRYTRPGLYQSSISEFLSGVRP